MASPAPAVRITQFDTLRTRPPTPPREAVHDQEALSKPFALHLPLESRQQLSTPPNFLTPDSSSAGSSLTGSRRGRKRVEWSAENVQVVESDTNEPRHTPPSSSAPDKPVKGILKPSPRVNPDFSLTHYANGLSAPAIIATMLESTIQQLAGGDKVSKLDAYRTLVQALRASDNLPDRTALREKMTLFTQFIKRDITQKSESAEDTTLITAALELLAVFLQYGGLGSSISNEFGAFMIDHSIRTFESGASAKVVVRYLMQIVYRQQFSPKVMTQERVGRLIKALRALEAQVSGKSIVLSRIQIYLHLIRQCRPHMMLHSDWLEDLLQDMLSTTKEVRSCAIALGLETGFTLGREKAVTKMVSHLLQRTSDQHEAKYAEFYLGRLKEMSRKHDSSADVAKIWGVLTLLIRGPLDRWEYFTDFFKILQNCFNSSDFETMKEANIAWNRLVYATYPDEQSFARLVSNIAHALQRQFVRKQRKAAEGKKLLPVLQAGVCNLLYYAFRPEATAKILKTNWERGLVPIITQLAHSEVYDDVNIEFASEILFSLLEQTTSLWKDDRIMDTTPVTPDELPALNAKLIRQISPKVFDAIQPILERRLGALVEPGSSTSRLWRSFVCSVKLASAKEIKVSQETSTFMADFVTSLASLWLKGPSQHFSGEELAPAMFLRGIACFVQAVVEALGILPFTEILLSDKELTDKYHYYSAPPSSRGSGTSDVSPRCPLHQVFMVFTRLPTGIPDDEHYAAFLSEVLAPFFNSKTNDQARIRLAAELLSTRPKYGAHQLAGSWLSVARPAITAIESLFKSCGSLGEGRKILGREFEAVRDILQRGLDATPDLSNDAWLSLFAPYAAGIQEIQGDLGSSRQVVSTLSVSLNARIDSRQAEVPQERYRQVMKILAVAGEMSDIDALAPNFVRQEAHEPLYNLCQLLDTTLTRLYGGMEFYDCDGVVVPVLGGIADFLRRCTRHFGNHVLRKIAGGLVLWVKDGDSKLSSRHKTAVAQVVRSLWDAACAMIHGLEEPKKQNNLFFIEGILVAAFTSRHRHFVNTATALWNEVFQGVEESECPDTLRSALVEIRSSLDTDVFVPGFQSAGALNKSSEELRSGAQEVPELHTSERAYVLPEDDLNALDSPGRSFSRAPALPATKSPAPVESPVAQAARSGSATPRKTRKSVKGKLRHEDSQLVFEPVESSPLPEQESQNLTEHQKEVRARQKDDAALFPSLRQHQEETQLDNEADAMPVDEELVDNARAKTPEMTSRYDYVASTPTPRRGQAVLVDDADNDPPSSPPEPKRYPLMPDLSSHSQRHHQLDNWQFSSPVGSPTPPSRQVDPTVSHYDAQAAGADLTSMETEKEPAAQPAKQQSPVRELPSTPKRVLRNHRAQETPNKSDDEFVDALSTPLPPTPEARVPVRVEAPEAGLPAPLEGSYSLALSEGEKRSWLRVANELEANPGSRRARASMPQEHGDDEALDCITVNTSPLQGSDDGRPTSKRSNQPVGSEPSVKRKRGRPPKSQVKSQDVGLNERGTKRRRLRSSSLEDSQCSSVEAPASEESGGSRPEAVSDDIEVPRSQEAPKEKLASLKPLPVALEASGAVEGEQDVNSQVVEDSMLDHSQPAGGNMPSIIEDSVMLDERGEDVPQPEDKGNVEEAAAVEEEPKPTTAQEVMALLRQSRDALRSGALSRTEMYEIEDMFIELRGDLLAAERRGRA